jgi:hypothetical protein
MKSSGCELFLYTTITTQRVYNPDNLGVYFVGTQHCQVMTAVATALRFDVAILYDILMVGVFSNILTI